LAGSLWGEAYSYDGFGNLVDKTVTQAPAPAMGVSYDANNHQLGLTYDANGNQLADAQGATYYGWNVENKLVTSTSNGWPGAETWYAYDPWGKRVMKDVNPDPYGYAGGPGYTGGAWEFYFYSITGQKLVTASCGYSGNWAYCTGANNVYFGGKLVKSNEGPYGGGSAVVTDRLGSVRNSGGVSYSYFPYGEERTVTADDTEKFGTYLRDGPGQDYAEQRYYNNGTGRFWSVDPGGIRTASPGNPISLNRYAYVNGDPVNLFDPTGKIACDPNGNDGCVDDDPDDACDGDVCLNDGGGGGDGSGGNYTTADITGYTVGADGVLSAIIGSASGGADTVGINGDTGEITISVTTSSSTTDTPIYGWLGAGQQILGAAGQQATHDANCFGVPTGVGATGSTLFRLGQPVAGTKPFVTPGSSIGTSPISSGLRGVIGGKLPIRVPTPVGGPGTGRPIGLPWSDSPGAVIGRWAPIVGLVGVIYGAYQLNSCLSGQ
jgi:RHS repeat-associated protein